MNNTKDFESKLKRLEDIVSKLEREDCSLDETVNLFHEGMKLSKDCRTALKKVEQSITKVIDVDEGGNPHTAEFESDDD